MQEDFDNPHDDFPGIYEGVEENIPHIHRMAADLRLDHRSICDVILYGSFEDDHLPCVNVGIVVGTNEAGIFVNRIEYKFSVWCIEDLNFLFQMARAPYNAEAHKMLVDYIVTSYEESVAQLDD